MNPDDIIKAAPEFAKGLTVVGAAIPFTAVVKRMLGPAADELAEMWRDKIRLYRYGNQMRCIEKAEKMAKEAGFTPKAVPPKILFPLLEGASMEDDESLHDMWAALLANASSTGGKDVRPSFLSTLKEMAPDEAILLKSVYELPGAVRQVLAYYKLEKEADGKFHGPLDVSFERLLKVIGERKETERLIEDPGYRRRPPRSEAPPDIVETEASRLANNIRDETQQCRTKQWESFRHVDGESDSERIERQIVCTESLKSLGLVYVVVGEFPIRLTARGKAFVAACSPPKPKA